MTATALSIRRASADDAVGVAAIYGPVVADTAISFERVPPTAAEIAARIDAVNASHAWLVAVAGADIAGYAYGTSHRARDAYRYSVETSVYVHPAHKGRGIGRALYDALLAELAGLGFYHAYAGITLPNAASVALHEHCGFRHIGTFPHVGFKLGRWHDVGWWHRELRDGVPDGSK